MHLREEYMFGGTVPPRRDGAAFQTFLVDERGLATLDWLVLVAGLAGIGTFVMFSLGTDVEGLTDKLRIESEEGRAALGASAGQVGVGSRTGPAIEQPLMLYRPAELAAVPPVEEDGDRRVRIAPLRDAWGSGAFEPAIAEPGRPDAPGGPFVPGDAGEAASPRIGGIGGVEVETCGDAAAGRTGERPAGWIAPRLPGDPGCL